MGEIGLAGELRRVRDLPQRIAEAARLGLRGAPSCPASRGGEPGPRSAASTGCRWSRSPDVASALRMLSLARSALTPVDAGRPGTAAVDLLD